MKRDNQFCRDLNVSSSSNDALTDVHHEPSQNCSSVYSINNAACEHCSHNAVNTTHIVQPELDENSSTRKGKCMRKMYLAALASLLMAVAMGMASGYSAPATYDMEKRPSSRIKIDDNEKTWIGSIIALGALTGGIVAGPLSDRIGRKGTLIYNSIPFVTGWLLIIYAPSVTVVLIGRFFSGFSCGLVSVAVPMYNVEISTTEVRGLLGSAFQGFLVMGSLASMTIGLYVPWSWLAVAGATVVIIGLMCLYPMPESPRWLISKGKTNEAVKAFQYLQGDTFDAYEECRIIYEDLELLPKGKLSWQEFGHPSIYKPALISMAQMFFQQCSGSNAILFYTPEIFDLSGGSSNSKSSSIIIAAIQVVATLSSNLLVDKLGRKILLMLSGLFMTLSLAALGTYIFFALQDERIKDSIGWLPLASLIIYISAFSIGYGPIPWLMVAEMTPVRARALIGGMASFFNGLFAFIVTKSFSFLKNSLGIYGVFWLYCVISLISCFFTGFLVPETKGKPLEEVTKIFVGFKKRGSKRTVSLRTLKDEEI